MEQLARLDTSSLRQRVYKALQEAIVSGELVPGARIRDQELATRLGVSRTPVREALQRLEDEGLVETAPRASIRVTPVDARAAREAFPVVSTLHALATRLAVPRLTSADVAAMREANDLLATVVAAPDALTVLRAIEVDDTFHQVLINRSENREIALALERVMPKVRRLEYARFASLDGWQSVQQHHAIIEACARGAAVEAAHLVEDNCMSVGRRIVAALNQEGEPRRVAGAQ
jgi:DNA-binding GntR family transcriptional regulator